MNISFSKLHFLTPTDKHTHVYTCVYDENWLLKELLNRTAPYVAYNFYMPYISCRLTYSINIACKNPPLNPSALIERSGPPFHLQNSIFIAITNRASSAALRLDAGDDDSRNDGPLRHSTPIFNANGGQTACFINWEKRILSECVSRGGLCS